MTGVNTTEANVGLFGVYGGRQFGGVTLNASLLAGVSENMGTRTVSTGSGVATATSNTTGWFIAPMIGAHARLATIEDGTTIGFGGHIGYVGGAMNAYTETRTTGLLTVGRQTVSVLDASLALDAKRQLGSTKAGTITGTASLGAFAQSNLAGNAVPISLQETAGGTLHSLGSVAQSRETTLGAELKLGIKIPLTATGHLDGGIEARLGTHGTASGAGHVRLAFEF